VTGTGGYGLSLRSGPGEDYTLKVKTSKDTTYADSDPYEITAAEFGGRPEKTKRANCVPAPISTFSSITTKGPTAIPSPTEAEAAITAVG
jgi:hypothetical protein